MIVKGCTNHGCAACKYRRRKYGPNCALTSYFLYDQPKMFHAYRLVSEKILKPLIHNLEKEATRLIIYESNIKTRLSVSGCQGIIMQLHYQVQQTELELHYVTAQLDMYQKHNQIQTSPEQMQLGNLNVASVCIHFLMNIIKVMVMMLPLWMQHDFITDDHRHNNNNNNSTKLLIQTLNSFLNCNHCLLFHSLSLIERVADSKYNQAFIE
ncbi:hypothetical protein MKW92_047416 [Papaver armeniacum]|nr:hypothetical protein MKW92_047416 [Papaver armeniacum]